LFIGMRTLSDLVPRGYGDHPPFTEVEGIGAYDLFSPAGRIFPEHGGQEEEEEEGESY